MAGDRELRLKAGFALARKLGTQETRALFAANNYDPNRQVVLALESDTVQEVFARLQRYEPPVVVAIFWPNPARIEFTQMEPGEEPPDYQPDRDDIGGTSTIGMLWEAANREDSDQFRFRLAWADTPMTIARFHAAVA